MALQALYELDQSTHDIDVVLKWRLQDLYGSAITSSMDSREREIAWWLLERYGRSGFRSVDQVAAASELEVTSDEVEDVLEALLELRQQADYGEMVVRGVYHNLDQLDEVIAEIAPEWPVPQMAPVDRNLLRIALWEMASGSSPVRVSINEAVELARLFSGEGSRRMVNGALGAYAARLSHLAFDVGSAQED
jgi:N utilization substance protein B